MFLTESYVEKDQMGYDPIYAMQAMQEATEDWNDICMKMIKLEHTAIVKEDANLLQEGVKEALTRFKNNVVVLGRKIMEYLERVRVQWTKIQASVQSKFVNTDVIKAVANSYNGTAKMNFSKDWDDAKQIVSAMSGAIKNVTEEVLSQVVASADKLSNVQHKELSDSDEDVMSKIEKILSAAHFEVYEENEDRLITKDDINDAINFIKQRPVAIKNIETMKKTVTQVMNAIIHELDKEDKPSSKNYLVTLQRAFNKMIIKINKTTSTAIKILSACKPNQKNNGISNKEYNTAKENDRKAKGVYYEVNGKVKKESVLDQFS